MAQPRKRQIHPPPGPELAFGEALRESRKSRGISQEQLAFDSELDRTYVSLLERGLKSPTLRTVFGIAGVLGERPFELVKRAEEILAARPAKPKH